MNTRLLFFSCLDFLRVVSSFDGERWSGGSGVVPLQSGVMKVLRLRPVLIQRPDISQKDFLSPPRHDSSPRQQPGWRLVV